MITVCLGEGGMYRVYRFWSALLLRRGRPSSAKKRQLLRWPLTINSELLLVFAEGEDSLVWFVEMLILTMLMLYPVYGKPYFPCCASNRFYSWWLDLEKREYEDWRVVLTTCVSAASPRPQQKRELGQRCSCLSFNLEPMLVGFLDLQDRISCIFLFTPPESACIFPNQQNLLSQVL